MGSSYVILLTDSLTPDDWKSRQHEFGRAKLKEMKGWVDRKSWEAVLKKHVPENVNIESCGFLPTMKDVKTKTPIFTSRIGMKGFRCKNKELSVPDSANLCQMLIELIASNATFYYFKIWRQKVTQAHIQTIEPLLRKIYPRPIPEPNFLLTSSLNW